MQAYDYIICGYYCTEFIDLMLNSKKKLADLYPQMKKPRNTCTVNNSEFKIKGTNAKQDFLTWEASE